MAKNIGFPPGTLTDIYTPNQDDKYPQPFSHGSPSLAVVKHIIMRIFNWQ